jgi:hypothetical protein
MMTRKDYVAVADILSDYRVVMDPDEYYSLVVDFGKMMRLDNDRFDLSRFMLACGIDIKGLVTNAMSTLAEPKPASQHVGLVTTVEEGWGRAY